MIIPKFLMAVAAIIGTIWMIYSFEFLYYGLYSLLVLIAAVFGISFSYGILLS